MSNSTVEEKTKEKTQYYKRIDDLIDDAEIEAEIEAENNIRSKNTKLLTISFVALAVLAFLYFGVETTQKTTVPPAEEKLPEVAQNPVEESLPVAETPVTSPVVPPKVETTEPIASTPEIKNPPPVKHSVKEVPPVVKTAKQIVIPPPPMSVKKDPEPVTPKKNPEPITPTKVASGNIFIQTGAFSLRTNAEQTIKLLKGKGFESSIVSHSKLVPRHVVFLTGYPDLSSLSAPLQELQNAGLKKPEQIKNNDGSYSLHLGIFKTPQEAEKFRDKLSLNGILAESKLTNVSLLTHFTQVGGYPTLKEARDIQKKLDSVGFKGSFIR